MAWNNGKNWNIGNIVFSQFLKALRMSGKIAILGGCKTIIVIFILTTAQRM